MNLPYNNIIAEIYFQGKISASRQTRQLPRISKLRDTFASKSFISNRHTKYNVNKFKFTNLSFSYKFGKNNRYFSVLERIKNYLKCTTKGNKLNSLFALHIESEIMQLCEVIRLFAQKKLVAF